MSEKKTRIRKKLEVARQELLDLGLRNPLLNYRTLKARGLEIVREQSAEVYRILMMEKRKMSFEHVVPPLEDAQVRKAVDTAKIEDSVAPEVEDEPTTTIETFSPEKFLDSKLQTNYTLKALDSRLLSTYYYARTYIEEPGSGYALSTSLQDQSDGGIHCSRTRVAVMEGDRKEAISGRASECLSERVLSTKQRKESDRPKSKSPLHPGYIDVKLYETGM